MKKFLLIFFVFLNTFLFGSNVYIDYPSNGTHYVMDSNDRAGVNYHILTVSLYFVTDWYGARVQYPDGHWDLWVNGQSGGWSFTQSGTYHIQAAVHVVQDLGGASDYYMYSVILTFYVDPHPIFTGVNISGPTSLGVQQNGTWNAAPIGGYWPFNYQWYYMYASNGAFAARSGIQPNLLPVNTWYPTGSNSPTLTRSFDYNANGVYLKCVVTDAHNITFTSNILTISIGGNAAVINSPHNNEATAKLADESPLSVKSSNEFVLKQNSPNPFNPTTIINYQLPEDGFVSLKIFDVLGREVQTLVNDFKNRGKYSVTFDASNLASGIYLYQLNAKNFISVKKMIVAK